MDAFEAVSVPSPAPVSGKKYFSAAEANRALVLVRRVVADIVQNYHQIRELYEACRALDARGRTEEAERLRQQYARLNDHLSELKEELEKIGCELKDYHIGLIDFPGRFDGREVYLCWKLGEERVEYWHELDAGYAGRQRISEAE